MQASKIFRKDKVFIMMDALKKELAEAFTDEDYVSSLTDVLAEQLIKSLKKAALAELEEIKRKILKNRKKILACGAVAVAILIKLRRG